MANDELKVVVLMGGVGTEREISIQSGTCIFEALKEAGANVTTSDIRPDDMRILDDASTDVFFIALHGEFGEDGQLQQVLEDRGLIYTGSGPVASDLAMDKMASKKRFAEAGVAVPAGVEFEGQTGTAELERKLRQFGEKLVVKPVRQGSTVGVTIADNSAEAIEAARRCLAEFGDCMIEEHIKGREITVGVLGERALPIIEIRTKSGFYDYHAKYIDETTEFLFDTIEDQEPAEKIREAGVACFNCLGCRDFARVDFMLAEDGTAYVLEVNTIPGFTSHSLLPKAAAKVGISMSDMCMQIVEAARENAKVKKS